MIRICIIAVVAGMFVGGGVAARAADESPEVKARVERVIEGMKRGMASMSEAVGGLTDAQKAKVAELEKSFAERIRKTPAEIDRGMALRDEVVAQFREILTPEQQKKLDGEMKQDAGRRVMLSSAAKLRQIGLGNLQYASTNGQKMPADIGGLVASGVIEVDVVVTPLSGTKVPDDVMKADLKKQGEWAAKNADFVYLAAGQRIDKVPFDFVVAHDRPEIAKAGVNFLLNDGSVHYKDPEKAAKILAELKAGQNPVKGLIEEDPKK